MKLLDVVREVRRHLEENGRVSLRMLRRQYELDDEALDELIEELVDVQRVARREENVLVWSAQAAPPTAVQAPGTAPPADQPAARGADARKVVTILFADLAGSTGLHERLDPESVNAFMERYYRAMRGAVQAHRGTVVKFLGDGVMAAFGVPSVAEDDAIRAVRAGVEMQLAFRQLAGEQSTRVGDIGLRVAINTGEVVVNADNTDVVGDPVNVAARLQQEARNGDVVLGESTYRLVAALVTLAPLGSVTLKGRAEAVKAYRVESLERPLGTATAAFVGRDDELGRINAVYSAAVSGPAARLAVLLGSPGLGKSRMIEEFARRLGDAATVLTAQCDAAGGATFTPLAEALREVLRNEDGSSGGVGTSQPARHPGMNSRAESLESPLKGTPQSPSAVGFSRLETTQPGNSFPGDALRVAIEAALPATEAERTRIVAGISALLAGSPASPEETFFVIRRFLAALASARPVVLVIDDLQWAEPLLLDLVEHLVQWGSGVPLLVLVGARPELRELRSSLVTPGGLVADVLTLAGLDAGAAMRLAANVIGAADLPAAVAAKVLATSEGNPLFVGELVRMLVQEGALTKEGDRWVPGVALADLEMPPTIHALLAARIERLRPEERSVLERAAVVGRHFSRSAVAELLPRDVVDLDARLEALRRSDLIQRDSGWFLGEPVLRFHHILIRDAAYRRLLKGTRAELHARFAGWVAARASDAADHDETIGWHLEQAHQLLRELGPLDAAGRVLGERAAQHLAAAGRRALARDDLPVAADLLGRAVDRLDVDDAARADLALDWCEALLAAGDVAPAAKAIDELGRFIGTPFASGFLPLKKGGQEGFVDESSDQIPLDPAFSKGEGERLRAWHTCFKGQLTVLTAPQGLQAAADAVAAAAADLSKVGDAAGEAKAHSVHAQALARLGKVGACEAALDQALAAARRAGDRRRANAVLAGAPLAALWGPSPVTRASGRCLDVVRVLRITQGAPAVESVALSCQGVLEALRGRTEAARRMLASSRKMVEDLGIAHRLFEADAFSGRIAAMEGDAAGAERLLRSAYEGLRELGLGIDAARAGALLARTLLAQDRVAEAESLSHESERLAGDDLQAAIAWRGVRAEALAKRGEHSAAIELAQAAVTIASATDALLDHADARMALAAALRAAGRGTEADAEQRRAIELWEAKGATLPAERARRVDVQLPPAAAAPETRSAPGMRRRIASNRATEAHLRVEAGNTQDLFSEDYEEIDHPTGSTFGRDANFASFERLMRSRDASLRIDLLAGLGDSLALRRRLVYASATGSSRFDVGEYENERILVLEVDERGRFLRQEVFAANSLGDAITRVYARHAELLPDGPERDRAAATARSLGTMLMAARDLESVAAVIAPNFESVDHRHLSTWSMRGGAAFVEHLRALLEVAADVVIGTSELLALEPSALLIRRMHSGTERLGGGAYERPFLVLFATDADGRLARAEWFDADREAEALARFDEIVVGAEPKRPVRRRVRPNAATRRVEREWAAVEARDIDALTAANSGQLEVIHHPTGTTYGAPEVLTMYRGLWRGKNIKVTQEVLATLGDSLALVRRSYSHEGIDAKFGAVGPVEGEVVCVFEVDESTQAKRSEVFAADRLGAAVARLYERFAELLPEGPERGRVAATARSVAGWNGPIGPDRLATTVTPSMEMVDHRNLGTWSTRGAEFLDHTRLQTEIAIGFTGRTDGVLALAPDALLVRCAYFGIARDSGGAFENVLLQLFAFGADGLIARSELWEPDHDDEALARFDALTADADNAGTFPAGIQEGGADSRPKIAGMTEGSRLVSGRRVRPNAATAWRARFDAALAARDFDAVAAGIHEDYREIDHPTGSDCGRDAAVASLQRLFRSRDAYYEVEPLATLGERLLLVRRRTGASGDTRGRYDVGPYENEAIEVTEVDEHGLSFRQEVFAADRLGAALVRLYERYAELLPEGPERTRAAGIARSVAVVAPGGFDRARYAEVFRSDVEIVDHKLLGLGTGVGLDTLFRSMASGREVGDQVVSRPQDVLALTHDALLLRWLVWGVGRESGGAFEWAFLRLLVFGADGRVARYELFDADREAQALARFEELVANGFPRPLPGGEGAERSEPFDNAASRADRKLFDCFNTRDWAGVEALAAPELVFDEHRRMLHNTCGREIWLEQFRVVFDVPASRFTTKLLATRGERLSLSLHWFTGEVAHGGGPLEIDDHLVLHEVDRGGRIVAIVLFDLEDEDAAYAELDARYDAGEGAAHARTLAAWRPRERAWATRDWDALSASRSPSFVFRDHRLLGWGATMSDPASVDQINRSLVDLAPDVHRRHDHVRLCERGLLEQMAQVGTRDGGAFENVFLAVIEFDEQGRWQAVDNYDVDRFDQALARFAELNSSACPLGKGRIEEGSSVLPLVPSSPRSARIEGFANAASQWLRRFQAAFNARAWDALPALYAAHVAYEDRQHLSLLAGGLEMVMTSVRQREASGSLLERIRLLGTRGRRIAMHQLLWAGGGTADRFEMEHIAVQEVDEAGQLVATINFDLSDLDAAYAELDARFAAGEGAVYPLASKWLADYLRYFAARDWNAMATLCAPDLVGENHRLVGWGTRRGPEGIVSTMRAQIELAPDTRERVDHVRICEHALLFEYAWYGTHAGGAFENLWLVLIELDADGRGRRADVWEAEQLDQALARFAELAGPAPDPFENAAARAERTLMRCFNSRDWAGVEACAAPDLVFDDRQPLRRLTADKQEWRTMLRFLFDVPARRFETRLLATRGERLSLHANRFEGEVADGGGPLQLDDHLALYEVDSDGRIVAVVLFAEGDEVAAHTELDARFEAGAAVWAWQRHRHRIIEARDWEAFAASMAPDFAYRDHRLLGWGTSVRDVATFVRVMQSTFDLAPDARYRDDHVRLCERGHLTQTTLLGTREGGAFETPMLRVTEFDESGRVRGFDTYDLKDLDRARVRFAELAGANPGPFVPSRGSPAYSPSLDTALKDGAYSGRMGIVGRRIEGFENAASRAWREVIAAWRGRHLERFAALQPGLLRYRDHRRLFQLDLDREGFLEFTRPLLTMRSARAELELLATRGERLALMRFTLEMEDEVVGPSAIDSLLLIETDERGAITAYDRYEIDDEEAARVEVQARWECGEGLQFPIVAWMRDHSALVGRRDWDAVAALYSPAIVGHDHRLVGWGTLRGRTDFLQSLRSMEALSLDAHIRVDHMRGCPRGSIISNMWVGTRDGGAFESPFLAVSELDPDGKVVRIDFYDPHHFDRALARFAEVGAEPNPLAPFPAREGGAEPLPLSLPASGRDRERGPLAAIAKPNAAAAFLERAWAAFDVVDLDAAKEALATARAHFSPDFVWEDRRPIVGLSGGLDLMLASARERLASGARHQRRMIVGTAGDRVAVGRILWAGGPPDGRFEVEFLAVHEVNEAGLCTALIFFDPDDERAAQREAWARWAAIEPVAAPWVELVNEFTEAWNGHDRARVRACFADDFVLEDHRHAGLGRIEGAEAYVDSIVVLWDLAPDQRLMFGWSWPVVERHGIVVTIRRQGTVPDGGPFETEHLALGLARNGRFTRVEFFEIDALDTALARFEELRPDPLRIPPNAATRAYDRWYEAVKAGNWDALDALYGASYIFDDRRRLFRETHGREGGVINTRFLFEGSWRPVRTLLATAGERLALQRIVWTTSEAGAVSEIEVLELSELDGEGRFVRVVLFDPDARAAASAELFERYVASGAGASHEAFELMRAWNTHDLARMRALLPDDFYLADHRRTGVGRLDGADAYLASIAAMYQLSHDLRTETLYIVSVAAHGAVYVARWSGTNAEGGEFDAVYVCVGLQRDGRPAGLEIFEIDALDAALARFEELQPGTRAGKGVSP